MKDKIIIGTRGSRLALWQAEWVKTELQKLHPELDIELNRIKTTGDKILDVPLASVGGKGLFVKEIEEALLRHEADIAVHSMKDVPTEFPEGLHLPVICKREDPRDAFIIALSTQQSAVSGNKKIKTITEIKQGARIGTSSLRRACQLLNIRPDLKIEQLRGNLDTRLRKLDEGQFDAIILAAAGVKRLGWAERITEIIEPSMSLPAIGQGAVGIECRKDDEYINKLISALDDPETSVCVRAERAFLKKLEGGCQVPIAGYARINSQQSAVSSQQSAEEFKIQNSKLKASHSAFLIMDGLVGDIPGKRLVRVHAEGLPEQAESLGINLAEDILSKGGKEILDEVYGRA